MFSLLRGLKFVYPNNFGGVLLSILVEENLKSLSSSCLGAASHMKEKMGYLQSHSFLIELWPIHPPLQFELYFFLFFKISPLVIEFI
jgi:hypothetical protein